MENGLVAPEWSSLQYLEGVLTQSPLLRAIYRQYPEGLDSAVTQHVYQPGEVLFEEGETPNALYVICSGRVEGVQGRLPQASRLPEASEAPVTLGELEACVVLGELDFFQNMSHSLTVRVVERALVLALSRADFLALVQARPEIGLAVMRELTTALKSDILRSERQFFTQAATPLAVSVPEQERTDLILHDLRNPINCMVGAMDLLHGSLPEPVLHEVEDLLLVAESSLDAMARLVNNLLDMARMEAGAALLDRQPVSISDMIERVVGRMRALARRNQIDLITEAPDDLPPVDVDADKVERVVANLVDNALKFTPSGGQIVVAACTHENAMTVTVTDTGAGVPQEWRERIFQRYTQAPGDRARRGYGLGLSYCHMIVTAHGGRIWAEPGPGGVGSRFAFTTPLACDSLSPV